MHIYISPAARSIRSSTHVNARTQLHTCRQSGRNPASSALYPPLAFISDSTVQICLVVYSQPHTYIHCACIEKTKKKKKKRKEEKWWGVSTHTAPADSARQFSRSARCGQSCVYCVYIHIYIYIAPSPQQQQQLSSLWSSKGKKTSSSHARAHLTSTIYNRKIYI